MKPTNEELKQRIALVAEMLCTGLTKTQIHRACEQKWQVDWHTADRYMRRARITLEEEITQERPAMLASAVGFYKSMLRKPSASDRDKILAHTRLDQLLGLDAPTRQEISGPDGGPLTQVHVYLPDNGRQALPADQEPLQIEAPTKPHELRAPPELEP